MWRVVIVSALLVGGASPAAAAVTTAGCLAKKLNEWGKLRKCEATENAKTLLVKPADPAKCRTQFDARLATLSSQAAAAAVPCRFGVNGDGTVTDYASGLQWEQKTDDGSIHDEQNEYAWSSTLGRPDGPAFTSLLATLNTPTSADGTTSTGCFAGHCDGDLVAVDTPLKIRYGSRRIYRLIDLVRHFAARQFFVLAGTLNSHWNLCTVLHDHMPADARASIVACLAETADMCAETGLRESEKLARRVGEEAKTHPEETIVDLGVRISTVIERIFDEVESTLLMQIGRPDLFSRPQLFGDEVARRFPSIAIEVEEAGKCLACGRYTASVFHLMRVMEAGLAALGGELKIRKKSPTWNAILDAIDKRLKPPPGKKKSRAWRRTAQFAAEAAAHLRSVKDAWRNPVMHDIKNVYDEEKATEVFNSVRAFMRVLATRLRE